MAERPTTYRTERIIIDSHEQMRANWTKKERKWGFDGKLGTMVYGDIGDLDEAM